MPRFSLRTKLTLALLVTGLVSASAVGLAGRAILLQRFDRLLLDQSFSHFRNDNEYFRAMRSAFTTGALIAASLSVLLGVFFGERLSRNLRTLTQAIKAMSRGELPQKVHAATRDEIGVMAAVINRVSEDLAASHARIEQQAEELRELSVRDALTGLHNRRHFDEQAALAFVQALRYKEPLTVVICDIDAFKSINDNFSHAVGDEVLREVAAVLRSHVRASDLVARYGGDEFVVVFQRQAARQVVELCNRIRQRIESHDWTTIDPSLRVTVSIGLDDDRSRASAAAMLDAADARLYEAKNRGRNRIVA